MTKDRRTALITGGTDGIGKAVARRLLREDWNVVVVGRSPARCEATLAELNAEARDGHASAVVADLSLLAETRRACDEFLTTRSGLDILLLNANAIAQTRQLTVEDHEVNLALGFLSRALMATLMRPALAAGARPQILTVVGLNKRPHLDLDDLTMARGFSGMKALGRWQWAMQMYAREWCVREAVPMNVYMPGIVKTKILDSEPNFVMRNLIKMIYAVRATTVDQSAEHLLGVVRDVEEHGRRDAYYSVKVLKPRRDLEDAPGEQAALWAATQQILQPYLAGSPVSPV
jgi:NAD(P)-dependent dehydrogenase (short-subunit alcohol dehydrogenase family)